MTTMTTEGNSEDKEKGDIEEKADNIEDNHESNKEEDDHYYEGEDKEVGRRYYKDTEKKK